MRLGRERPRKSVGLGLGHLAHIASMRLGRERPRKRTPAAPQTWTPSGFNEAGARTPQKGSNQSIAAMDARRLQ